MGIRALPGRGGLQPASKRRFLIPEWGFSTGEGAWWWDTPGPPSVKNKCNEPDGPLNPARWVVTLHEYRRATNSRVTKPGPSQFDSKSEACMAEKNSMMTGGRCTAHAAHIRWAFVGACLLCGALPAGGQCIQEQQLSASDAAANDGFGISVAVDVDTAVIGAHGNDEAGENAGAAYVFVRSGGVWSEQQKLTAADAAPGDFFGWSVSLSGDTLMVAAQLNDDAGNDSGSAYVFVRSEGVWSLQQKLTALDATADDHFGFGVSVKDDTAVVGANRDDGVGADSGSAYVFVRSGGVWTQQQKLTAGDSAASDQFGSSVAVDGETAVIGSRGDADAGDLTGSAYVFLRTGTVWAQQQKLTASDAMGGDSFGRSVSVSANTAVVGAPYDDGIGSSSGSAYVFVRSGLVWTQQQKLMATDAAAADAFGNSVAVSGDTAVIGATNDDHMAGIDAGSAYVFIRSGTVWTQQQKLIALDAGSNDILGVSVSLSGDNVVAGAYQADGVKIDAGSAYVFYCGRDGACCVDGACAQTKESACNAFEGVFFGQDTMCDAVTCPSTCEGDIIPCPAGDGMVDIFDILGVLDAFSGADCCVP